MTTSLCFNEITLSPVTHQNSLWIRAAELARALGYKDENSVRRIYDRNQEEFTPDMTQVIEISEGVNLTVSTNLITKARLFSLRGCHLIAMFARTPVAKAFRRWVLDVLDKLAAEERAALAGNVKAIPQITTRSTAADRAPLRALVHAWSQVAGVGHAALWPQVKAHFQLSRIDDLPVEWLPDSLAFVQGKIDGYQKALPAAEQAALPCAGTASCVQAASFPPEALALLEEAERDIIDLHFSYHRERRAVIEKLRTAYLMALPRTRSLTSICEALALMVTRAITYPDQEHVPAYALPGFWLRDLIPGMVGKDAEPKTRGA